MNSFVSTYDQKPALIFMNRCLMLVDYNGEDWVTMSY